ncbi:taste receptor type 2 member 10 [Homo sapiens]|uniref:Taste receptor type 2 member 10 n=2 Tax=Homo sapiens TaxID=9606 RepID=T2R10_HUMAN|nr:taste receptor type 2 member 10 [Homo sapiens]Q9NYW0.3 RecName: Full=Taste receptor type 2 member 10; Short=T2R10; AltName: Full=Taste receptor family B member 2; Short=TRB2 [Homo sapiens]AAF43909.1 candidate taste receptor T2R10 [Homo sapiens]|eukprot:NP_076410.1 taste receptor type 2 member 10 [Homo sapiens]
MLRVVEGIFIFVVVSESVFGVLGNGFIGLVNCIDCAKNKLSTIGFILTGLAISRIFLIWIIITDGFIQIFSPNIYASGNLIEYISYFWVIGNQSSMWFATSLSIFYFLKIANFSNYIFLWLKSRTNMVLPFMIVFLLISSLLNFAYIAKILNDYKTKNDTVWDLNMYKSEYFIKQILLNLGVIFFFTLSLITCIFLIISLWRHNRQMQSNVTGLRDSNTEAHVKAMKVLISFIILFILYFIGMAIEISCFTVRENKLLLMFGMTTTAIYPWGHSFILILGNSKLKQASLRVLQQLKCCEKRKNLRVT